MSTSRPYTIRVSRDLRDRIEAQAVKQRCSPSDIIRAAIEHHLDGLKLVQESELRHLRISEYVQIALDWIIQQDHSDARPHLIAQTDLRMERYHGAR